MVLPKDPIKAEEWKKNASKLNSGKNNPMYGKHHSKEVRDKISAGNSKKVRSPEYCIRLSLNNPMYLPEVRKKVSDKLKGKPLSPEHCKKISENQIGRKQSEETKLKISDAHKGEKHHNWKGGISFAPYCEKFDNPFKERVRIFFGRVCVECGNSEIKEKLHVHHVNFDKMTCCNDAKPLYVALCRSCHMKTNFNREYWERHFTDIINNKYNGQCYIPRRIGGKT
jgi:hypothetical protein